MGGLVLSLALGTQGDGPGASRRECFQARDVVQILGISRRQLHYWARTELVAPSVRTQGGHSRYTFQDLVALRAAKKLIDAGVSVQRIRKSIRALQRILPSVRRPLAERVLVATGDVVLVLRDGAAFEAISGQEWVLPVAELEREIRAWRAGGGRSTCGPSPSSIRRAAAGRPPPR